MCRAHADVWTSVHLSVTVLPNLPGRARVLSQSRPPSRPQLVSDNSSRGWLQIGMFQPPSQFCCTFSANALPIERPTGLGRPTVYLAVDGQGAS
jgi:hypothetical protein